MSFKENWRQSEIGKEIELSYGKGLTKRDRKEGDYPVYGSNGITDYHDDYLIEAPGIIVGRKGTIGKVEFTNKNFWPIDTTYYVNLLNEKNHFKFWYYFLESFPLEEMNSHSAVPGLNREQVYKLKCFVPPLREQKEISKILSSLDEKIENNKKINKNLEEMAQAIYKSWFVDFEPFQEEEFVDSELGMIPVNMELKSLKEFFPVKTGKKNANIADDNGQYAFFTCSQEMKRANEYSFDDTAILLAGNGDFNVKWYRGKFEAYQRTYVLIPDERKLFSFLYYSIDHFLDKLILGRRGSVISYLTKGMIEDLKIPVLKDQGLFNDIIERLNIINCFIENNKDENQSLKELRDSLLPKLMSGEIRVPLDEDAKEVN